MEEIIRVENIKKTFRDNLEILKGISFSVEKGEVLSIIGPSGSGKSTMLRCISQLETVTDGTIKICGQTLVENGIYADKKARHEIILKSGLVFQNFNLFSHYSVLKNVSAASSLITARISPVSSGSSADVGSSKSRTSGFRARARAIETRCC